MPVRDTDRQTNAGKNKGPSGLQSGQKLCWNSLSQSIHTPLLLFYGARIVGIHTQFEGTQEHNALQMTTHQTCRVSSILCYNNNQRSYIMAASM